MPRSSAEVVRKLGFETEDVRDIGMAAAKDREIIEYALRDNGIIITRDADFGEVLRCLKHLGAIIFRLPCIFTTKEINKRLKEFCSVSEEKLRNTIIIVELSRYRRRPIGNL